jgi:hypothetical protein
MARVLSSWLDRQVLVIHAHNLEDSLLLYGRSKALEHAVYVFLSNKKGRINHHLFLFFSHQSFSLSLSHKSNKLALLYHNFFSSQRAKMPVLYSMVVRLGKLNQQTHSAAQ